MKSQFDERKVTITLDRSQAWLIAKAIVVFTDDENMDNFLREFPDCDQDLLVHDIDTLMKQIGKLLKEKK